MISFKEYLTENWGNLKGLPKDVLKKINVIDDAITPNSKYIHFKGDLEKQRPSIKKAVKKLETNAGYIGYILGSSKKSEIGLWSDLVYDLSSNKELYIFSLDIKLMDKRDKREELKDELERISKNSYIDVNAFLVLLKGRLPKGRYDAAVEFLKNSTMSPVRNHKIPLHNAKKIIKNF